MSNLLAAAAAVNAGGHGTPELARAPASPPAELPPCPECGGELMRYLNRVAGEDELLCLECWWAVPTASFAVRAGEHDSSSPARPVARDGRAVPPP